MVTVLLSRNSNHNTEFDRIRVVASKKVNNYKQISHDNKQMEGVIRGGDTITNEFAIAECTTRQTSANNIKKRPPCKN